MRIGIFGGSFNPPHVMHERISKELIKKSYVDKIIFVPTGNNYLKKDLIEGKHRLEMLKLICDKNMEVSDYEIKAGSRYTYQTLDHFKNIYKNDEIYFIMGMDNLEKFDTWKKPDYILGAYKILIINRNNGILSSKFVNFRSRIVYTDIDEFNISSSEIRRMLKIKRKSSYISKEVLEYIIKNNLYLK